MRRGRVLCSADPCPCVTPSTPDQGPGIGAVDGCAVAANGSVGIGRAIGTVVPVKSRGYGPVTGRNPGGLDRCRRCRSVQVQPKQHPWPRDGSDRPKSTRPLPPARACQLAVVVSWLLMPTGVWPPIRARRPTRQPPPPRRRPHPALTAPGIRRAPSPRPKRPRLDRPRSQRPAWSRPRPQTRRQRRAAVAEPSPALPATASPARDEEPAATPSEAPSTASPPSAQPGAPGGTVDLVVTFDPGRAPRLGRASSPPPARRSSTRSRRCGWRSSACPTAPT